jgi:EmrB/QacA subfamily drug resistance transporter
VERERSVLKERNPHVETATLAYQRRWWTLAVLCFSLLVIGVDNTILNVALPTLVRVLHATSSQLQWMVDAYTLVFAGLLLTAGSLGDRFGRKKALSIGLMIFGTGSVLSAFAGSASQLIATRSLMGVGGAIIMPATLSILTNTFTNPSERAKAIGIWAGVSGMGIAVGPIAGGWLLQHFWWGSVFLVNVPVVVLGLIGGWYFITDSRDPSKPKLDPVGAGLSIVGLTALLWALIEAPSHGWLSAPILSAYAIAAAVLTGFILWERRSDHPMLDVRVFENPRFSAASSAITLVFFSMFGSFFVITQYLQDVKGYSPLQAGLRIAPIAAVLFVAAPMSSTLVRWFGSKLVVAGGLAIAGVGLLLFSGLAVSSAYVSVLLALLVLGLGMSFTMAPATESIMGSLPRAKAGVGSAVNDTTRQVGGALGVAVLGSVVSSSYASKIAAAVGRSGASPTAAKAAHDSIGGAVGAAQQIGGQAGQVLATAARSGFVGAMRPAMLIAAGVTFAGVLVVLAFLPARAVDESAVPATVPVGGGGPDGAEAGANGAAGAAGAPDPLTPAPVAAVPALTGIAVAGVGAVPAEAGAVPEAEAEAEAEAGADGSVGSVGSELQPGLLGA